MVFFFFFFSLSKIGHLMILNLTIKINSLVLYFFFIIFFLSILQCIIYFRKYIPKMFWMA